MRYGYHLVTDCLKANQGKKSQKDVEATIIHHLQHLHQHHGDQAQALPGRQASRHPPLQRHHHRQSCGPELAPRRHVNQPFGGHQPGVDQPGCPWPPAGPRGTRSSKTTSSPAQSARRSANTPSTTASARQRGLSCHLSRSKRRAVTVPPPLRRVYHRYFLLTKQMRDSGLPADVLVGKLKKDISSLSRFAGARSPK